jgi:uncharacterized membrane protein
VSERLRPAVTLLAALGGVAISIYLTLVHASAAPLACSASGVVDCERVLSSGFGVIGGSGVPTSAAGIVWFAVSGALALARLRSPGPLPARLQLAWSVLGLAVVLGLVFVEIVLLGALCAWCTAAHVLVLVTFLAVVQGAAAGAPEAQSAQG